MAFPVKISGIGANVTVGDVYVPNAQNGIPGAILSPVYVYSIVPLTSEVNNIVLSSAATVANTFFTLTAGTNTTSQTLYFAGQIQAVTLDVPRNVTISTTSPTGAGAFVIKGYDVYKNPLTEHILTTDTTATFAGKHAFLYVISVEMVTATGGTITVGTGQVFGLPYSLPILDNVSYVSWNGAVNTGTSMGLVIADSTNPATSSSGDVRGTVLTDSAPNGVLTLNVFMYVSGAFGDTQTQAGLYGVTPYSGS